MTASKELQLLIVEIDGEIDHFRQLQQQVGDAKGRLPEGEPDAYDRRSVAMLLAEIYVGAENLMRRVATRLGEAIPNGAAWHQQLLAQFCVEAPNLRPALYAQSTQTLLEEFRRFRHVAHHVYAIQFDWPQESKLLAQASMLLERLIADAESFKAFLTAANEDTSEGAKGA